MLKPLQITLCSLSLSLCLFGMVVSAEAQQQSPHGPGSSGPPLGQYQYDQHRGNRINAVSMLSGPMYESAISDWNSSMGASLSTYRILMNPTSRAARVGIQNCDRPYFDSAINNMRYIIGRIQEIRNQIDFTQTRVARLINAAQQLQDDTIEAQGEPGLPLVGTAVEAVIDTVPVAGPMVNAAGDEDDRQVQVTLYDAHQKKKRFRAWLPRIEQYKQQADELLALAQRDLDALNAAFQPDVCHVCGQQAQAEPHAQRVDLPPANNLPVQPDAQMINKVMEDFNRVTQQATNPIPKTQPTLPPRTPTVQPGPNPNDY
jgi:hypothetical protein